MSVPTSALTGERKLDVFKAALADDLGAVIVALGWLTEEQIEHVVDAAQLVDGEGQWFLEKEEASA